MGFDFESIDLTIDCKECKSYVAGDDLYVTLTTVNKNGLLNEICKHITDKEIIEFLTPEALCDSIGKDFVMKHFGLKEK